MATCQDAYFGGWSNCSKLLQDMIGAAIQVKGNVWTDAQTLDATVWRTAIADDDPAVRDTLLFKVLSFSNTTDEIGILTSASNRKFPDGKPIPSGIMYIDANICDYQQLHGLNGTQYEMIPSFKDNTQWRTRKTDGNLKGLRCRIETVAGFTPDDKLNSYPVHVFFDSYSEFEKLVVTSPDFTFSDLFDYSPASLKLRVVTAYTGGQILYEATKIGSGDPYTTLTTTAKWLIRKAPFVTATVAVTAIDITGAALGQYLLTVKKDNDGTPTNLASTDKVYIQAQDDDATYATYVSAVDTFNGGA